MRGLAIISIMLHNYCHLFRFAIKESEFEFKLQQSERWIDYIQHPDINLPLHLLSTFGFYLLPAFMFLGGYGLVRKYEQGGAPFSAPRFVFKQWRKLLALVLVPQLVYLLIMFVLHNGNIVTNVKSVLLQFTMASNLIDPYFNEIRILPYPYWYLGMMMELYVIYALIHRFQGARARLWIPVGLIATGFVLHCVVPRGGVEFEMLRSNATVAFIPFGLGLLAARYGKVEHLTRRRAAILLPVFAVLIVVGCFNYHLWVLNHAWGAAVTICAVVLMRGFVLRAMTCVGTVSALVYILHPLAREVVMTMSRGQFHNWPYTSLAIYVALTAIIVIAYHGLKIDKTVNRLICGKSRMS